MLVTSVAIPPLAVGHRLHGTWRHRGARPLPGAPDEPVVVPVAVRTPLREGPVP